MKEEENQLVNLLSRLENVAIKLESIALVANNGSSSNKNIELSK